jgi:biopolymer transport protein ExbB/TolQ
MAGGVSKAIIPPMAGLAVALIGNFAQQYIKNITQRESDMLYHKLVIE